VPQPFTLVYEDKKIDYNIYYSVRKTISIEVTNNQQVIVKAPATISNNHIHNIIQKKANWIVKKLAYYKNISTNVIPKQYIDGEQHLYLGTSYPLNIYSSCVKSVGIIDDVLHVTTSINTPDSIKKQLQSWYLQQSKLLFLDVFENNWEYFIRVVKQILIKPTFKIRTMKSRWGSCSTKNIITLNSNLIKYPQACIEVILMHEFCHLIHFNHSKAFYNLLTQVMPMWKEHERSLNALSINHS
jgi:predicted metal-dependent hydrolase